MQKKMKINKQMEVENIKRHRNATNGKRNEKKKHKHHKHCVILKLMYILNLIIYKHILYFPRYLE